MNPRQKLDQQIRRVHQDRLDRESVVAMGVILLLAVLTFIATR